MTSDSAMFDGRRRYHPTSILSPIPYPLSDPSTTATLAASLLRTSPSLGGGGDGNSYPHQADMADELLAYNHAHVVPLTAASSASQHAHSLRGVSSTSSLSSLGSRSSQPLVPAAVVPRPSDVDYELFDIFQMASSFEGAGGTTQLFQHSIPLNTDPLASSQPLSPASHSSMPLLSPPHPPRSTPSSTASQHLQDAMLRQLAGSDGRAAFLSLSPLPPSGSPLTPPPVVPLQSPMAMQDETSNNKRELRQHRRDTSRIQPAGPIALSPPLESSRSSASSTPTSAAPLQPPYAPSHSPPASSASSPVSPYSLLPPALLQHVLTQQQSSRPSLAAAAAVAASQSFPRYPLPTSPSGVPLAPHSHSTMQEYEDDEESDDDEIDETELPRASKRTHLASPSSHASSLPHRSPTTRTAAAPDEKQPEPQSERPSSSSPLTVNTSHKDLAPDQPSTSSPTASAATLTSRLSRKAELARASRKRKKMYVADLEEKVSKLAATVEELQKRLKKNAGGLSKEERVRREQQSAIKERLTQLIAQAEVAQAAADGAAPVAAATASTPATTSAASPSATAAEEQSAPAASSPSPSELLVAAPATAHRASPELQELVTRFVYNSRERQGHVDYYFDRVSASLQPGLQVRFAMWGLTQPDAFYGAPGLWQSLMEGEIGLDTQQMEWILSKRTAIHAERKNLQTCELMLRETRNAISMHLHSLHGHMDDLLSVMTPLQLAKFYLWVENNAWCMQMLARWS